MARRLLPLPLALVFALVFATPGLAVAPPGVLRDRYGDPLPPGAIARLGSVRFRHVAAEWTRGYRSEPTPIRPVFSPDGKSLVTVGPQLRWWDAASGRLLREFQHDWDEVNRGGIFSPDGKYFLSLHSAQICVRELQTDRQVLLPPTKQFKHHFTPREAELYPDLLQNSLRELAEQWQSPLGVAFHPTLPLYASLVVANRQFEIRLHEFPSCRLKATLTSKADIRDPTGLSFSPDGRWIVFGSMCYLHIFDLTQGKELPEVKVGAWINKLDFAADGRWVVLDLEDESISLVCLEGRPTLVPMGVKGNKRSDMRFLPGRKQLLFADRDGSVIAFEPLSRHAPRVFLPPRITRKGERSHDTVTLSPDGRKAAFTRGPIFWVVDLETGRETPSFDDHRDPGDLESAISPCGRLVVTRSATAIRVWELKTGKLLWRLDVARDVAGLGITPDGRHIVACANKRVTWWDLTTGKVHRFLEVPTDNLVRIALIWQGQAVSCAYARGLEEGGQSAIVDALSGKEMRRLTNHSWTDCSRIGMRREILGLQELRTGKRLWKSSDPNWSCQALTPDGRLLLGVDQGRMELRESISGRLVKPRTIDRVDLRDCKVLDLSPEGRTLFINREYAPHGRVLDDDFSGGRRVITFDDRSIQLVETSSGKVRKRVTSSHAITLLNMSPDGRHLIVREADGSLTIRDVYELRPGVSHSPAQSWATLASDNAEKAFEAICQLIADPTKSVQELDRRLQPTTLDDPSVRKWLRNLASDSYQTREEASRELAALGEDIEEELRSARRVAAQLETRRRLDRLLAGVENAPIDPIRLQRERALEALEHIGTREARALLQRLAGGTKGARMTVEARDVLERLAARRHH